MKYDKQTAAVLDGLVRSEREELTAYAANVFEFGDGTVVESWPFPPEPHIETWQSYLAEAETHGVFCVLASKLVQLRFPVRAGISQDADYRAATRRGEFPTGENILTLQAPELLQLTIHDGAAGPIPVITAPDRDDFVSLVRALIHRNEPVPVPNSMGAVIVSGFNNWDRVHRYRQSFEATPVAQRSHKTWAAAFKALIPDRPAYQDRFILLSEGPYSAVDGSSLGLEPEAWRELSHTIRLEHEYTHYFTRRVLGSMRNNLLDELAADAAGLLAATGQFNADWFLRFLGLEHYPEYRDSGRLQNYRGEPGLSDGAFRGLMALIVGAANNLEAATRGSLDWQASSNRAQLVLGLSSLNLQELASADGRERIATAIARFGSA